MNQQNARNRKSKKEQHQLERKQSRRKREIREATDKGKEIIYQIAKTINHFFPDIWARLDTISDTRKKSLNIQWPNSLAPVLLCSYLRRDRAMHITSHVWRATSNKTILKSLDLNYLIWIRSMMHLKS